MKTIAVIVGTVPEAVKLGPVCQQLARHKATVQTRVILTGQHRDRVTQILSLFGVRPWHSLGDRITRDGLAMMAAAILHGIVKLLRRSRPELVVVQGDTATAFVGALAAFYEHIPVAHVEAGLTTGNVAHPFPEEMHREVISRIATILFAPSERAAKHATQVARPEAQVFRTGNPCVDALVHFTNGRMSNCSAKPKHSQKKRILVTVHRRENHGTRGEQIGRAIAKLALERQDAEIVFVGHNHPGLSSLTNGLQRSNHLTVLPPQGYPQWLRLLGGCHIVISDSGGAQEEGPWLGKPVLVLRDETERPEVVEAGATKLVGTDPKIIYESALELLDDERVYRAMQMRRSQYPYGHGKAAPQIVRRIMKWLTQEG